MDPQNNLRLLVVSLFLAVACAARLAPDVSPSSSPSESLLLSISEPPSAIPPSVDVSDLTAVSFPGLTADSFRGLALQSLNSFADHPDRFEELPSNIISANSLDFSSRFRSVGPNPIVAKICENTDHPPLCLATVLPFVRDEKSVTVESVLKVAVDASSLYAEEALSVTKKLLSKPNTPKELKGTLKDCKNSYDTAVENFAKTVDAFATNDVGTMRSVLSAVITYVGDCEAEFAEMNMQSPLSGYAEKLTDMTSNCLAIVQQMM